MEFRVLGPMEVSEHGRFVPTGGGRSKAILAALLLHANKTVSRSRLIELVWAHAPDSVDSNLRSYLAKLRKALHVPGEAHSRVVSDRHGFRIVVYEGELDLAAFESRAEQGETAMRLADPGTAREHFEAALGLWRGAALTGALIEPGLAAAVAHLEERRDQIELRGIEARMELGQHAELVGELRALVAAQPSREHLVATLMLALYRSGRQKEALAQYQQTRARLVDELGVEPSARLEDLHRRILNADPQLAAPAAPRPEPQSGRDRVVPSQLPADIAVFTGRESELLSLRDHARACTARESGSAPVAVLDGMGGVGKTTLAVHAARLLVSEFPDGQLFIDLHGFSGSVPTVDPNDALDRMLRALGVAEAVIPEHLEDRAALYRSVLAERRVLIVLDNAASDSQVRPLLPGGANCLVIVTSRRHLALDEATPIPVGVLGRAEGIALFMDAAAVTPSVEDEPTVTDIVEACGRLPLAVRIAAARLRSRPRWTLRDMRDRLTAEGGSLPHLELSGRSVAATFDMSYKELDADHARLFRLLGLIPGWQFDLDVVCALLGEADTVEVESRLENLVDVHLLESPRPGRYGFHDLLRTYAIDLAAAREPDDSRTAAWNRVIEHYLCTASRATMALHPLAAQPFEPAELRPMLRTFADTPQALAWFGAEYHTLRALTLKTVQWGRDDWTCRLVAALDSYFWRRGLWRDWSASNRVAAEAAERLGDNAQRARAHRQLGRAASQLGRFDEAKRQFDTAFTLFGAVHDYIGQGDVQRGLGLLAQRRGDTRDALTHAHRAMELYGKAGFLHRQANCYNAIGWRHALLGEYQDALRHCQMALRMFADFAADGNQDFQGEAETLDSLGYVHHQLGDTDTAVEYLERARELLERNGERFFHAEVTSRLGDVYATIGDHHAAHRTWKAALATFDDLGHSYADDVRAKLDDASVTT